MKNFLLLLAVSALAVFTVNAFGAPQFVANLTLADGGRSVVPLQQQSVYRLQCPIPVVYKLSTDGGQAAVGTDIYATGSSLGGTLQTFEASFQSGAATRVNATAVDGGQTQCLLFLDTQNLPR